MIAPRITKTTGGRYAVTTDDGHRLGIVYNNGARRTYGRSWTARNADGVETRHMTRRDAAESLVSK